MTEMTKAELDKLPGSFPPEPRVTEKWIEEFDKKFQMKFITALGEEDGYIQLKSFITKNRQDLVESILAEIPDDIRMPSDVYLNNQHLKQLIRDKYGK